MRRLWLWVALGVLVLLAGGAALLLRHGTMAEVVDLVAERGELQLREPMRPIRGETRVLLLALDGVGDGQVRAMAQNGRMPHLAALLGAPQDDDVYSQGYAVPGALSILPSTTMAAWTSIFTGKPAAETGVPGNEWFVRETMRYYAPGPNSVDETDHTLQLYTDDLLGRVVRVPTLYELADVRAHASLAVVSRGADLLTVPSARAIGQAFGAVAVGVIEDEPAVRGTYSTLDESSVDRLLEAFAQHGLPDLQVVYFPGIDLYTHLAEPPIPELERYLEEVTDPAIGRIVQAYVQAGVLERTWVVVVSDHGHTPVVKDDRHALGTGKTGEPPEVLERAGFRLRPFTLDVPEDQEDYQTAVAYQGAMAYLYLADRSTCPNPGERCSWMLPPRLEEDVLPVVRAFDRANRLGEGVPALQGTLDLIMAREPRPPGEDALPFQVWHGDRLVAIGDYLARYPRPDLPRFEERMRALAAGPYGHRAGDVLLLARSGMNRPIHERFYFSREYHSWHGSPEWEDSRVPIVVARSGRAGQEIKRLVDGVVGDTPSQLHVVPLILRLLKEP